jgi:hypothetical protein
MGSAVVSIVYNRSSKFDMTGSSLDENENAPARLYEIWVLNGVRGIRTRFDHTQNVLYAYLKVRNIFQYICQRKRLSPPMILRVTGRRGKSRFSVFQRSTVAIFFEEERTSSRLAGAENACLEHFPAHVRYEDI